MKKYFLSLVAMAAMLFATSCQESLVEPQMEGPTTFTVQLPDQMGTKAIGSKANVNQLLVAVYQEAFDGAKAIHRQTAEMGYYIAEEYWGKGIMTDAVKQICEYVFKNSDILRIYAEPFAYNTGSCRVLEKAGFQYEGTLRNNAVKNGKVIDMKMYSLLREEQ